MRRLWDNGDDGDMNKKGNMKKKITVLLKIATEPHIAFNKRLGKTIIHFGDINRGEHIIPLSEVMLSSQFVKDNQSPELSIPIKEPEFRYFVHVGNREIEVTGCLWFELQDILLEA